LAERSRSATGDKELADFIREDVLRRRRIEAIAIQRLIG
jgi:hypothetical protein